MPERVLIETYGCTLNQADSRIMGSMLKEQGYEVEYGTFDDKEKYDFVIMNTCTVKSTTEQKILHRIQKIEGMGSRLVIAGCMASANQDKIEKTAPHSSIITTSNIHNITNAFSKIKSGERALYTGYLRSDKLSYGIDTSSVIARIPISEGCLSTCSFCETKFARGPLNSFSQELILKAVEMSVDKGSKEIELTSQDVGAYGLDRKTNIAELASAISGIDGDFRVRIGMLNPEHLHRYFDTLVESYKSEKLYKFIHLPVQSGSNNVLHDMKRNYSSKDYEEFVLELRKKIPGITIATDVIVGYPTETQEDFEKTLELLDLTKPEITNVSKFAVRPHAKAKKLKQLPSEVIKQRSIIASRKFRRIQHDYRVNLIGSNRRVLITERNERSFVGRDDSYNEVAIANQNIKIGEFVDSIITDVSAGCLIGRLA